jgi:hypothetical protein
VNIYDLLNTLVTHSNMAEVEKQEGHELIDHLQKAGAFGTIASRSYSSFQDHEHDPYKVYLDDGVRSPFRGLNQAPTLQLRKYVWACKQCHANLGNGEEYVNR